MDSSKDGEPRIMTLRSERDKLPHNRKRNVGLVFEFLVRHMAHQAIERDRVGWQRTYGIIKRYFSPGSPLARELELFNAIRSCRGMREASARKVLDEVLAHASKIDANKLDIKKSNLIKEINYAFGKDFFSRHRISDYKLFASIQLLIDNRRSPGRLSEDVQRVKLEEAIVSYMMSEPADVSVTRDDQVDSFAYGLAEDRFRAKYGRLLNERQRELLDRFASSMLSGDHRSFREHVLEEKVRVLSVMRASRMLPEVASDPVMKGKLEEAISRISSLDESGDPEGVVEEVMLFEHLTEELTKDA